MQIPGYTIKRKLGAGGMAEVYLATQQSFGRDVALKILSSASADKDFAARFVREAKIVAGLSHPHIVPVYDVGKVGDLYYMSMDNLSGGDLDQWIKAGIPETEILKIIEQIAEALQYAHHKGCMHRDIKPGNIMFREDNSAVLTDFGIARMQNADDQLTQVGAIIGTPRYMSPEALKGQEPDGRADIYALGIVFYQMFMKDLPYKAADFTALALKHIQEPIPQLPRAYAKYQEFLNKFIAKDVTQRFQTGREIVKAIHKLQENESASLEVKSEAVSSAPPASTGGTELSMEPISDESTLADMECGVTFEELAIRRGLFKKHKLVCNVIFTDAHTLSFYISNTSDRIREWHYKYRDKLDSLELNFTSQSWFHERADDAVTRLYKSGGIFEFLKKIPIHVNMLNLDGSVNQSYTINTKGEKVSSA